MLDTIPAAMIGRVIAYMQGMIAGELTDDALEAEFSIIKAIIDTEKKRICR